jgi:hypothetical protein
VWKPVKKRILAAHLLIAEGVITLVMLVAGENIRLANKAVRTFLIVIYSYAPG